MIPQRIELRTYPYQEHALPIKLRNLIYTIDKINLFYPIIQEHSDLNWVCEVWSFMFYQLNYALFPLLEVKEKYLKKWKECFFSEKRWFEHPSA